MKVAEASEHETVTAVSISQVNADTEITNPKAPNLKPETFEPP